MTRVALSRMSAAWSVSGNALRPRLGIVTRKVDTSEFGAARRSAWGGSALRRHHPQRWDVRPPRDEFHGLPLPRSMLRPPARIGASDPLGLDYRDGDGVGASLSAACSGVTLVTQSVVGAAWRVFLVADHPEPHSSGWIGRHNGQTQHQ